MAALPYMPLYVGDYMGDAAHLSTVGHGAYFLLIMSYWQKGGPLPDDDRKLASYAKMDAKQWKALRNDLAEFFIVKDGQWRHKRVEEELEKARSKSAKARDAGRASAQARLNGRSTDVERMSNHPSSESYPDPDQDGLNQDLSHLPMAARAEPSADRFPDVGTIEYSPFAAICRRAAPGLDVDVVAGAFRKFCRSHDPPIPLDAANIARRFEGFASKHAHLNRRRG